MGLLQTAWQTFIDRVLGDAGIKDYFAKVDLTDKTGVSVGNFLEVKLGVSSGEPKAAPTLNQVVFPIEFQMISKNTDSRIIEKQALKGLEVFLNAVEKQQSDATWQASFVNTVWEVESINRIDSDKIEINGLITLRTQPYTMGAL